MRDFIQFWAKFFFMVLIALGSLLLLFVVDFSYIIAVFSVFAVMFTVRLVIMVIQVNKHYAALEKAEQERNRVKYVIIK